MVVSADPALTIAGVAIALAVPLTFMVANYIRKNVEHGEARFGPDGKVISDEMKRDEE
ncbi:MAG: glutamyl-tRNA amidotransferase [Sphingomonadales bacterium BRH_c3]|nr:MAG: glutamyl-tRNA amidotransferase [Sphingomonadales bacterium BRH_c3]